MGCKTINRMEAALISKNVKPKLKLSSWVIVTVIMIALIITILRAAQ